MRRTLVNRIRVVAIAVLVAAGNGAAGELKLDLAGDQPVEMVPAARYETILIENALPLRTYAFAVEQRRRVIAPIDLRKAIEEAQEEWERESGGALESVDADTEKLRKVCGALEKRVDAMRAVEDESEIPEAKLDLAAELDTTACTESLVRVARGLLEGTTRRLTSHQRLTPGRSAVVTVTRGSGDAARKWTKEFDTGKTGEVRSHFVLGGLANRDDRYFVKPSGENAFEILEEADRRDADFTVGVLFAWFPEEETVWSGAGSTLARLAGGWRAGNLSGGVAIGAGFDFATDPVLFLGYSVLFSENFGVAFGVAGSQQQRLRGQYAPEDVIGENLQPEQLVEETFSDTLFVGITYRR